MDTKKPRNSILRVAVSKDDENTTKDNTVRLKRRISFSGKKYVREFRGEEEAQTWNNSYDVSDHANMSTDNASVSTSVGVLQRQTAIDKPSINKIAICAVAVADKENIYCDQHPNSSMASQVMPSNNSRLYITTELIDKSQQQNSSLLIDNTVDCTLLPHERVRNYQFPRPPSISFSMEEYEIQQTTCTAVERTIDCTVEPQPNHAKVTPSLKYCQQTIVFGPDDGNLSESWKNEPSCTKMEDQTLVQRRRNEPITIFMDESIDIGSQIGKIKSENRRTIQKSEDIEFSLLQNHTNIHDKENMIVSDMPCATVGQTADTSYNMEIESPPQKIPQTSLITDEAMNIMEAVEMFDNKLKRISLCENSNIEEDRGPCVHERVAQDDHLEVEMDMSIQSEPVQMRRNVRQTIHFNNDEVHIDGAEVEKSLVSLNFSKEPQTLNNRKTIVFNDNDGCTEMNISSTCAKTTAKGTQENIPPPNTEAFGSTTKSKQSSVMVVRKVCAPAVIDLEKQRFQRYQKKQAQMKCDELSDQKASAAESKLNRSILDQSLSDSQNGFFSPERSSPLFPPEYVAFSNRKLNFRQLNNDIEHGKIQIFPELPKTPSTDRKCMPLQSQSIAKGNIAGVTEPTLKRRGTLHFGEEMQLSANESLCGVRERKPTNQNNYYDFENTQAAVKKKNKCRYSEADDMLLDSTSFLAQAKLGDETASRNSSKCSTSNRRETIHFNSEIEVLNETTKVNTNLFVKTSQTPPNANIIFHQHKDISISAATLLNFDVQDTEVPQETHTNTPTEDMEFSTANIVEQKHKSTEAKENDTIVNEMNCEQKDELSPLGVPLSQTIHFTDNVNIDVDCDATTNNKCNVPRRETLIFHENCELDIGPLPSNTPKRTLKRKMSLFPKHLESELEDSLTTKLKEERATTRGDRRKTVLFEGDNSMNLDVDTTPTDMANEHRERLRRLYEGTPHKSFIEFEELERATEMQLEPVPQIEEEEPTKAKDVHVNDNLVEKAPPKRSILRIEHREGLRRLYEGTPHRSVIELKELEQAAEMELEPVPQIEEEEPTKAKDVHVNDNLVEKAPPKRSILRRQTTYEPLDIAFDVSGLKPLENQDCSLMIMSPVVNLATKKRLTANLTPNLPVSKKRQTLVFSDCDLDESIISKTDKKYLDIVDRKTQAINKRQTNLFLQNMDIEGLPMVVVDSADNLKSPNELNVTLSNGVSLPNTCEESMDETGKETSNVIPNIVITNTDEPCIPSEVSAMHATQNYSDAGTLKVCTTPSKSRIPVLIGSAKKSNSISARFLSPKQLEDSTLNHSLETIQIPRRATLAQSRHSNIQIFPVDIEEFAEEPKQHAIPSAFEHNPITISDVSVYYQAQRQSSMANEGIKTPSTADPIHLQLEETKVVLSDTSITPVTCSDNEIADTSKFKKRYINLSCNSSIDKTSLNLVETLLDDDDDDDLEDEEIVNLDEDEVVQLEEYIRKSEAVAVNHIRNASACRKCKRCQETFINETTTSMAESFVLPIVTGLPVLPPLPGMERLRRLRQRPTLADVNEYYRRKSLERPFNIANFSTEFEWEDEEEDEEDVADLHIENYRKELERLKAEIVEHQLSNPIQIRESFVKRLDDTLRDNSSSWIFDYQMQYSKILQFHHRQITTSSIVINYEEMSSLGEDIEIKCVKLQSCRVQKKNWKPIDFVMDFQLKLELPYDLQTMCGGRDEKAICAMLRDIDSVYAEVAEMGNNLWRLVCQEQASLISDGNRIFVRKIVRKVITPEHEYPRVQRSEFRVEVTNVTKLCFKDIASPPLHSFREEIQFLPIGLDFLHAFLSNPSTYLRTHE